MTLVSLRQILDHAAEHGYGMPAFNITNLETLQAVLVAAKNTGSPAIVQVSQSARKYADDAFLKAMFAAAASRFPDVPLCVHQDHGSSPAVCRDAIAIGCSSVMMDGSLLEDGKTPSDFDYNARTTAETVRFAHELGVSVEGEIGVLGSLETGGGEQEDGHGVEGVLSREELLTDPEEAARFVEATGVDALAVAIGTSHGAYKFSKRPDGDLLALDVISAIHARLPNTHLVMHGASTVPQYLQDQINEFGGEIPQTFGVPVEEIVKSIKHGVRKVNIDTDLRMAFTGAVREALVRNPSSFDTRSILKAATASMTRLCEERFQEFGAAGKAAWFKSISLEDMAEHYRSRSL